MALGKNFEILERCCSDRMQYISHNGNCTENYLISVKETVKWPCLQMIQQYKVQKATVFVRINLIKAKCFSGFVKIELDKFEAIAFRRCHFSDCFILNKNDLLEQVFRCLEEQNNALQKTLKTLNTFSGPIYHVIHMYSQKCLLIFYNIFAKTRIGNELLIYVSAAETNFS